ncbi:hypothetical protein TIFTF001_017021 [Ficus carica]|uniref:Uncharacterized protein n=1 Tax=Ficus carica TaxID=3494 RepID=A0AA88A8H8_FICCA|nr:hypothetical protein TIFTF001_017021 [Ficus carica]
MDLDDGLEEHGAHVHPGVGLLGHFVNSSLLIQTLSSSPNVASAIFLFVADSSLNVSSPSGFGIEERNACFRFESLSPPIK